MAQIKAINDKSLTMVVTSLGFALLAKEFEGFSQYFPIVTTNHITNIAILFKSKTLYLQNESASYQLA